MKKDIRYYEEAYTEAIRRIVGDSLANAPFDSEASMAATLEALKRDIGFLESVIMELRDFQNPESGRELSADEARQALHEALGGWERPCRECGHNKGGGCTKRECVVEKQRIEDALEKARRGAVFKAGEYYDFGTEDAFGGVFGYSYGCVKIAGREGNEISFEDTNGGIHTATVSVGLHNSEMFYPFGREADAEGHVFKAAADHQELWISHSKRFGAAVA
jgi:hypothetical protein